MHLSQLLEVDNKPENHFIFNSPSWFTHIQVQVHLCHRQRVNCLYCAGIFDIMIYHNLNYDVWIIMIYNQNLHYKLCIHSSTIKCNTGTFVRQWRSLCKFQNIHVTLWVYYLTELIRNMI